MAPFWQSVTEENLRPTMARKRIRRTHFPWGSEAGARVKSPSMVMLVVFKIAHLLQVFISLIRLSGT